MFVEAPHDNSAKAVLGCCSDMGVEQGEQGPQLHADAKRAHKEGRRGGNKGMREGTHTRKMAWAARQRARGRAEGAEGLRGRRDGGTGVRDCGVGGVRQRGESVGWRRVAAARGWARAARGLRGWGHDGVATRWRGDGAMGARDGGRGVQQRHDERGDELGDGNVMREGATAAKRGAMATRKRTRRRDGAHHGTTVRARGARDGVRAAWRCHDKGHNNGAEGRDAGTNWRVGWCQTMQMGGTATRRGAIVARTARTARIVRQGGGEGGGGREEPAEGAWRLRRARGERVRPEDGAYVRRGRAAERAAGGAGRAGTARGGGGGRVEAAEGAWRKGEEDGGDRASGGGCVARESGRGAGELRAWLEGAERRENGGRAKHLSRRRVGAVPRAVARTCGASRRTSCIVSGARGAARMARREGQRSVTKPLLGGGVLRGASCVVSGARRVARASGAADGVAERRWAATQRRGRDVGVGARNGTAEVRHGAGAQRGRDEGDIRRRPASLHSCVDRTFGEGGRQRGEGGGGRGRRGDSAYGPKRARTACGGGAEAGGGRIRRLEGGGRRVEGGKWRREGGDGTRRAADSTEGGGARQRRVNGVYGAHGALAWSVNVNVKAAGTHLYWTCTLGSASASLLPFESQLALWGVGLCDSATMTSFGNSHEVPNLIVIGHVLEHTENEHVGNTWGHTRAACVGHTRVTRGHVGDVPGCYGRAAQRRRGDVRAGWERLGCMQGSHGEARDGSTGAQWAHGGRCTRAAQGRHMRGAHEGGELAQGRRGAARGPHTASQGAVQGVTGRRERTGAAQGRVEGGVWRREGGAGHRGAPRRRGDGIAGRHERRGGASQGGARASQGRRRSVAEAPQAHGCSARVAWGVARRRNDGATALQGRHNGGAGHRGGRATAAQGVAGAGQRWGRAGQGGTRASWGRGNSVAGASRRRRRAAQGGARASRGWRRGVARARTSRWQGDGRGVARGGAGRREGGAGCRNGTATAGRGRRVGQGDGRVMAARGVAGHHRVARRRRRGVARARTQREGGMAGREGVAVQHTRASSGGGERAARRRGGGRGVAGQSREHRQRVARWREAAHALRGGWVIQHGGTYLHATWAAAAAAVAAVVFLRA
ncbi:hypothetical protein DENSPDRAFT_854752 [Dentipellis sp. KUC8613]|nr:hypothetical protein DENSPDRAFT_854752 [Dentipellis sp. KUC8613]